MFTDSGAPATGRTIVTGGICWAGFDEGVCANIAVTIKASNIIRVNRRLSAAIRRAYLISLLITA
jgi:hypothetical protein